jgi:4-hydroxy-tetrahydrodipicolinate synthase
VPCGTTGETPTLTPAERRRIVEICVEEAAGRSLVLAGAGGYDTHEVIPRRRPKCRRPARTDCCP